MRQFLLLLALAAMLPAVGLRAQGRKAVLLETTAGNIRIELYDETPLHRDNFLSLVGRHFYDSLLFHRVIRNFMVQAGDPHSRHAEPGQSLGEGTLDYKVSAEIRLPAIYHKRGAVAMARDGDDTNPQQMSDACQFYIVWGKRHSSADVERQRERLDTLAGGGVKMSAEMVDAYRKRGGAPHLDGAYTVFGEVTEGLDVIERIQSAVTDDYDRPVDDIRIVRAVVAE